MNQSSSFIFFIHSFPMIPYSSRFIFFSQSRIRLSSCAQSILTLFSSSIIKRNNFYFLFFYYRSQFYYRIFFQSKYFFCLLKSLKNSESIICEISFQRSLYSFMTFVLFLFIFLRSFPNFLSILLQSLYMDFIYPLTCLLNFLFSETPFFFFLLFGRLISLLNLVKLLFCFLQFQFSLIKKTALFCSKFFRIINLSLLFCFMNLVIFGIFQCWINGIFYRILVVISYFGEFVRKIFLNARIFFAFQIKLSQFIDSAIIVSCDVVCDCLETGIIKVVFFEFSSD